MSIVPITFMAMATCGCLGLFTAAPCLRTGVRYGLWPSSCPDTDMRLTTQINAWGLVRGRDQGQVEIVPTAHWLRGEGRDAYPREGQLYRGYDAELQLQDHDGQPIEGLTVVEREKRGGGGVRWRVKLDDLPDGDYQLSATTTTSFETSTHTVPLALYAPALVHTMTDRPLYKPGQTVLFRSATLRRTDEKPLEGRPGRWVVRSPSGLEMLVEKDAAGPWGIADGSFPIDEDAEQGQWSVTWQTGEASDTVTFDVRPFRLPRFTVEAAGSRRWYAIGQPLVIEGRAAYSSGAPVANAPVKVGLRLAGGRWPLPIDWEEPREVRTGPDGRYRVDFGAVPPDLMDRATLTALVEVTEQAGERASGAAQVVLSHESLKVEAVTELGDGLVEGFNNRAYVRATTPDGRPLANATLVLTRPYDPTDAGKTTTTDADGVAALQIDPGPPVTVVQPPPPPRIRPFQPTPPSLVDGRELSDTRGLDLEERRAVDRLQPRLQECAVYSRGEQVQVGARVDRGGAVRVAIPMQDGPLARCVADTVRGLRMPAGDDRTYTLSWSIPDAQVPSLSLSSSGGPMGGEVDRALGEASTLARRCLQRGQGVNGSLFANVHWVTSKGSERIDLLLEQPGHDGLSPTASSCVASALRGASLRDPATADAVGVHQARLSVPAPPGTRREQPTVSTAYELKVVARADGEALGDGRLILPVGAVPNMRLRATPSLTTPDTDVTIELVRGPTWRGDLPKEMRLYEGTVEVAKAEVKDKAATFHIPADVEGFLYTEFGGARAVVFVAPADPLSVQVASDQKAYEPGGTAHLTVTTRHGDAPVAAGVTLVGVDSLLAQLAPLTGPDDFGRVTVRATSDQPPFGTFDARALALGQIRGENAARAAVMRIGQLPRDPAGDQPASANGGSVVVTDEVLVRNFYRALGRTAAAIRAWEKTAPAQEQLENDAVVGLWDDALADLRKEGDPAVDAWGRELSLAVLPREMLAQVDPRKLVSDGTRRPEDVEDFVTWVVREVQP
ncbi:MAG: hypothetical protein H6735_25435 [Alphaproteobacteria bacterium]|nr:hypothetical protein [Alphaproteobacteria bacterium]